MFKLLSVLKSNRGSASMMWLSFLPVILLIIILLGNLATAGMTHASTNKAAEAGAIAAIEKLDYWLLEEVEADIEYPEGAFVADLSIKEKLAYADQEELKTLAEQFINERRGQLVSAVRKYVENNGGDTEGTLVFPVHNQHIQVKSRSKYEPFAFDAIFAGTYINGKGLSPGRDYLTSLDNREINY